MRYAFRVVFVVGLGVLLALVGDVYPFGIGGRPVRAALLFGANRVALWTLIGLAMAWATKAEPPSTVG